MFRLELRTMSIGARITTRMRELGLKPGDLVRQTSASKATVSQWINDQSAPSAKYLSLLCEALHCSERWLVYGDVNGDDIRSVRYARGLVPVISKVQAGSWREEFDEFHPGDAEEYLPCPRTHSELTFALRVEGDSMTASQGKTFPSGVVVYCDPEQAAGVVSGDMVIAKIKGEEEVTFKQYQKDGPRRYLKPLNTAYPIISDEFEVIAKVIGSWSDV